MNNTTDAAREEARLLVDKCIDMVPMGINWLADEKETFIFNIASTLTAKDEALKTALAEVRRLHAAYPQLESLTARDAEMQILSDRCVSRGLELDRAQAEIERLRKSYNEHLSKLFGQTKTLESQLAKAREFQLKLPLAEHWLRWSLEMMEMYEKRLIEFGDDRNLVSQLEKRVKDLEEALKSIEDFPVIIGTNGATHAMKRIAHLALNPPQKEPTGMPGMHGSNQVL